MKKFKLFLIVWAAILVVAITVVSVSLWKRLDGYQKDYDAAAAAANPDVFADGFVRELSYETISRYIEQFGINTKGPVDTNLQHAKYFSDMVNGAAPRFERSEKFTDRTPVYDIFCGSQRMAVISLKSAGKNDDFGYHLWQLKDMAFDTDVIEYKDITIDVPAGFTVTYNGFELGEENLVKSEEFKDIAVEYAIAAGGQRYFTERYAVNNVLGEPIIKAVADEVELAYVEKDGNYDFVSGRYNEQVEAVRDRVYEIIDAYILNIYRHKTFWEIVGYLERNSDAYKVIYDVQASIAWSWKPATVDILEQNLTDCVFYNDNLFTCSYYGKIYKFKEGAQENGEEEFRYRMLYKKINGQWVLSYFVLNN